MSRRKPGRNRGPEQGLTLVELLVTMMISGLLLTLTLGVVNGNRRLYDTDSRRIEVNQNLQSALRVVSNDVRQTGERLAGTFPALEIKSGPSDTVTLYRNLLDVVLPVCQDIKSGSSKDVVPVSKQSGKTGGDCKNENPNLLSSWKAYREARGGSVEVYIYDPVKKWGETFTYDSEDASGKHIHRSGGKWANDYDTDNSPVLYVLEKRQYAVTGGQLTLSVNNAPAEPVAPGISSLKAPVTLKDGTVLSSDFPTATTTWKNVRNVTLTLSGSSTSQGKTTSRTLSEAVTPRNIFSAEN